MTARKRSAGRAFETATGDALRQRIADNLGIVTDEGRDPAIETTARIKETPTNRITCPTCSGKRTYTVTVPNMKGPSNNRYHSSLPTPYVERSYFCPDCAGRGFVYCVDCRDTGTIEVEGHFHGPAFVACPNCRAS